MKIILCEPNRYEITVKIPKDSIKTRGKAEKPAQEVHFVSKWYVIHMIYGLNRYEIKKAGQNRPILWPIVAFERQQNSRKIHQKNRYEIGFDGF